MPAYLEELIRLLPTLIASATAIAKIIQADASTPEEKKKLIAVLIAQLDATALAVANVEIRHV